MIKWWMTRNGYQIYPRSFFDSNNDGIGDIKGITLKLDYLKELGIDLIWICPFYDSPMDDNGYDVRNFFDVAKEFGTLDDFKELLKKAKTLDIKIILDFVLNHTSDEHPWFIESRSSINNDKRDYYIWEEGKLVNDKLMPPTNWGSFFSGSAWNYDQQTNMFYMKIFSNKMPDLNWKNKEVRNEMINVGKWWLDLGVDGFRIDAVSHLDRAPFIDSTISNEIVLDWNKFSNLPKVHTYLKELNEKLFSKYDALTIGEVGGAASIKSGLKYSAFDRFELSMVFNFDHNWCNNLNEITDYKDLKTDVLSLKRVFNNWQTAFTDKGWLPLNWLNHDQPRLMSHYGDLAFFKESAKMLATALYLMRGMPFIYQGEEIGMTNYHFTKFSEFNDVSSINHYHSLDEKLSEKEKLRIVAKSSRDHARTGIQWENSEFAGFSKVKPKVLINSNYKDINVLDNISDESSIWHHYKKILELRKNSEYQEVLVFGKYKQLKLKDPNLYIYERESNDKKILVINSFSKDVYEYKVTYKVKNILLKNYEDILIKNNIIKLRPYESVVLEVFK
ncbi:alpha-glucosidase [Haploplasma modicum]|uniref:alpha-glucosidase n=1 Tax=Haploplasma modicum TaxID=2150 RepID=UPI00214CA822|nr:alpha-glucosidase [Haploplasma modicum]